MKKLLLTLAVVATTALTMYGQGRVGFNNTFSGTLIGITSNASQAAPGEGAAGAHLGSNYSIQLLWALGSFATQAAFNAANPSSSLAVAMVGTTGNDATGAGFFDGGVVAMNGAAGTYTMQARAWFNNGQFATYASAAGHNQGVSPLFSVNVTAPPTGVNNTSVPAFVVQIIPEPATFALAGLGAAALLLFRRRK